MIFPVPQANKTVPTYPADIGNAGFGTQIVGNPRFLIIAATPCY